MKVSYLFTAIIALAVTAAACQPATNSNSSNTSSDTNNATNSEGTFTTNQNAAGGSPQQAVLVRLTPGGAQPATTTVPLGTTVTFKNEDTVAHQVSSDPHPAHTDLPGFDRVVQPGGSYSFTFSRTGEWGFHDHLNALDNRFSGVVIVQ